VHQTTPLVTNSKYTVLLPIDPQPITGVWAPLLHAIVGATGSTMASRKKKPTKLRHELREYTSLIRTLHTTSTQDIIPHLTGSFLPPLSVPSTPSKRATSPPESLHDDASDEYRASRSPDEDEEVNEESKGKGRGEASEPMKRMYKDVWTRWPLLMNNVYVPEWTLQDEVRSIAEKAARRWADEHANGATPDESTSGDAKAVIDEEDKSDGSTREENESTGEESGSTEEDQDDSEEEPMETEPDEDLPLPEEDIITKGVLNGLSLEASNLLSHIFGMLAAHRPAVDASLQNRLGTMDWQTSLKIISSAGVIDRR
jgi:hypothetical protein